MKEYKIVSNKKLNNGNKVIIAMASDGATLTFVRNEEKRTCLMVKPSKKLVPFDMKKLEKKLDIKIVEHFDSDSETFFEWRKYGCNSKEEFVLHYSLQY